MLDILYNHVPPDIMDRNIYVKRLFNLLDQLVAFRKGQMEIFEDSFEPLLDEKLRELRLFVDEFGGEYLNTTPKKCLECLYFNKYKIFSSKGTVVGLTQLLTCLTLSPNVVVTYSLPLPLINLTTLDSGVLPEGLDIKNELSGLYTPPGYVPTLLDGSWSDYYTSIIIDITTPYDTSAGFKDFLLRIVPFYLLACDTQSTTIIINFI